MIKTDNKNNTRKVFNEGSAAEGVLGAAIVAKISLREPSGKIGKVNSAQVRKILQQMVKTPGISKGAKKTQIKLDFGGSAKDKIIFFLNLGPVMTQELQSLKDLKVLDRVAESAASYVNSPRIEALAEALYNNNINNTLEIDVDGISNNTGTKADIEVRTDKYVFDKISLKAGAKKSGKTLGQVGGNSWSSILKLFHEGFDVKKNKKVIGLELPINTSSNEDKYMKLVTETPTFGTVVIAVKFAFKAADVAFNSMPQTQLANKVYKFLSFHSTSGDSTIKLVILHLGKHKTLDPLKLEQALLNVKLKAVTREDTQWPVFLVYDSSGPKPSTVYNSNVIFAIRPKMDSRLDGYIYNLVESGPKFDELLEEK